MSIKNIERVDKIIIQTKTGSTKQPCKELVFVPDDESMEISPKKYSGYLICTSPENCKKGNNRGFVTRHCWTVKNPKRKGPGQLQDS